MNSRHSFEGQTFRDASLSGARFVSCDLTGVVVRGSEIASVEIDSPWLIEAGNTLLVNGVDVLPHVDAELNRRFPGRELRRAHAPEDLRRAWAALEATWSDTVALARSLPESALVESVDGEWSLSQTLRHLVFATDIWLGRAILGTDDFHPLGLEPVDEVGPDADDPSQDVPFKDVLAARRDRQARVRDYLGGVTDAQLDRLQDNPHGSGTRKPVRSCLHTILEEEWEHHRYAVRDLAVLMGE